MLKQLIQLGIDDSIPEFERKNINVINLLSSIFFLFPFLYHAIGIVYYEKSLAPIFLSLGSYQACLLITLYLQKQKRVSTARLFFITVTLIFITISSLLLGRDSMIHFYLLSGFFTAFYIFPRHQNHYSYIWCILYFVSFCTIELWKANPYQMKVSNIEFFNTIKVFTVVIGISSINFIKSSISRHMLYRSEARIEEEQHKVERLLFNTLPVRVVAELKEYGKSDPRGYKNVTVFFSDIVDFTSISSQLEPNKMVEELNSIFTAFDLLCEKYNCERIKTIGDAYLAVCGLNQYNPHHCSNILKTALEAVLFMENRNKGTALKWKIRVGVHTGEVVGGIVGVKKYIYDVFGDTVNTAQRMESNSAPMKINVSEAVYQLEKNNFAFCKRNEVHVKGKGGIKMYWLDVENNRREVDPEIRTVV